MMKLAFDKSITQDFDEATRREWIDANGRGGWAAHRLLERRPGGTMVSSLQQLVRRLEEWFCTPGPQQHECSASRE